MSYSRWSNKFWYAYESRHGFEVQGFNGDHVTLNKKDLIDLNNCAEKIQQKTKCSDKEVKDLKKYMQEYIEEKVDHEKIN